MPLVVGGDVVVLQFPTHDVPLYGYVVDFPDVYVLRVTFTMPARCIYSTLPITLILR